MPSAATTPTKTITSPTHMDLFCTPELTVGKLPRPRRAVIAFITEKV